MSEKINILKILQEQAVISQEQADEVQKEAGRSGLPIEKVLEKLGFANEEAIMHAKANFFKVPYIDIASYLVDLELIASFPEELAKKHKAAPLFKMGNVLTVAMVDPHDIFARDHMRKVLKMDIEAVLASEKGIQKILETSYGSSDSIEDIVKVIEDEKIVDAKEKDISEIADETPVIKLVNFIIMEAVKEKTSDIHIEPDSDLVRLRYRIDGMLHEIKILPAKLHRAIVSRIKVMGNMDISESRRGQDGRIRIKVMSKEIDIRVSTFPTVYGENVVMRLLDKTSLSVNLKDLGFPEREFKIFDQLIRQPNGIVLVTGPTGSGKTTTLYSALSAVNTIEKNIMTVEDPVEYEIPLIRQCCVNTKADVTFANALRIILRQDPNVVMIGEIRDSETAGIAMEAALTGHLVLSTLHTNDAPSAVTRLIEMGVEPFLISSSVIGVLAQRLVRAICKNCKEKYNTDVQAVKDLGFSPDTELFHGKGCSKCKNTGYAGRRGIYELLVMTNEIRRFVEARKSSDEINKIAIEQGMKTLRENGLELVRKGVTTIDEVLRVTREEY